MLYSILTHEATFIVLILLAAIWFIIKHEPTSYEKDADLEKYNITKITKHGEVNIYKRNDD